MWRPAQRWALRVLPSSFLVGALWGSSAAVLEALLFNRRFHAQLQQPVATFELVLNYAIYAGLGAVFLVMVVEALRAARRPQRSHARAGRFTPNPTTATRMVEAFLGAGITVAVLANFLRIGPFASQPVTSSPLIAMAAGAAAVFLFLVWAIFQLPPIWRRVLRIALLVWIVAGVLWTPLFGRYTGLLDRSGEKAVAGSYKNVLFILVDTLRRDFLDCYGADWRASPAAGRLAASGALFDNQIAQSTWTLPSTASLLTGLYPSSHGAVAAAHPISPSATTLAEVLQRARFRTGAFVENLHVLPRNGFGRGFDRFWAYWLPWVYDGTLLYRSTTRRGLPTIDIAVKKDFPIPITRPEQVNWNARTTTDRALEWLRSLDEAPFFAYIHYMGPHGPYGPPEFLLDREPPQVNVADHPRETGGAYPVGECGAAVTGQAAENIRTLYAADILYVEREIGRILDWLEEAGKMKETLVVYTTDHGEEFYEHCGWNHGKSAFDEVLRVPFIVSAPGSVPAGMSFDEYTRHIDVMPTILDLLGLACPETVQGRSLRPLLEANELDPLPAYTEVYPSFPRDWSIFSLVKDHFKLIDVTIGERSASLLYDLQTDPSESHDLAAEKPELVRSLEDEMSVWDRIARRYSADADTVPLDKRSLQRLKSLGYVQ